MATNKPKEIRNKIFNFLGSFGEKIKTKFNNISGKTGQYSVPTELFQKRTNRKNRVLIPWKTVEKNNLNIEQLKSFSGGVAIEFINEDFFNEENYKNPIFIALKDRLGSDDIVSSIITIRSESGSSSSAVQREYYKKLINNTKVNYKGKEIIITEENYRDFTLKTIETGGMGNEKWTGFLFVSIKGGQQDIITSCDKNYTIFNPACEFANEKVSLDLDLVMSYFAMISIDISKLNTDDLQTYNELIGNLKEILKNTKYDNESYTGNLLDYCDNHPSIKMQHGHLYDPIQVKEIHIEDFAIDNKEDERNLDFTHDEAVNLDNFYWDKINNCILSPARPTNVFWSKHLSNMMQQNFSLQGYFDYEEEIIKRRNKMLNKND